MKHFIVTAATAALLGAIVFIGTGYLHTHRAERVRADRHAAVHAMSLQALAAAIARCDAPLPAGRDDGYCEDIARELDERPLEAVQVEPERPPGTPASH